MSVKDCGMGQTDYDTGRDGLCGRGEATGQEVRETGPDSTMGQESQILSHTVPRSPPHLTTIPPRPLKVPVHLKPVSLPSEFLPLGTSATLQARMPGTVRPLWSVPETSGNKEPISSRSPLSTQQSQAQPGQMGWTVSPLVLTIL